MKKPYTWDDYSDQPHVINDKTYKRVQRKKHLVSFLKTLFLCAFILPLSILAMPFVKRKIIDSQTFFCLGVDYERNPEETLAFIKDLGVKHILLRIKLWDLDTLDALKDFLLKTADTRVTLKILQDRENVTDLQLFHENLKKIFSSLNALVDTYEIGSSINRAKWGFFSVDEYNAFFKTAYDLRNMNYPHIKLIGSGVIDFEYHFTIHTLFNLFKYKYDGISALLYVDRRGAPENTQLGFSLSDKIALLSTMVGLSKKTAKKLYLTETNWPISHTAPYAPTSEKECVSLDLYADYMLRYYLLAFASQQVDTVSWHQLIAPGYGLIDNRNGIHKYPAYQTYKIMIKHLSNAQFLRLDIKRGYYILQCLVDDVLLQIHWSLKPTQLKREDYFKVYSRDGEKIQEKSLNIGSSPLYIFIKN